MFWLERPPWAKWVSIAAFTVFALWLEIKPAPVSDHPFAAVDIEAGEQVGVHNTELRSVPAGLLAMPEPGAYALVDIPAGSPVVAEQTGEEGLVLPSGWWVVAMEVPQDAVLGDRVKIVLLDDGSLIDGVVSSIGNVDGFELSMGGVAVAAEAATRVAAAASNGRLSVLVSTG